MIVLELLGSTMCPLLRRLDLAMAGVEALLREQPRRKDL
jgi:hypothetical protein